MASNNLGGCTCLGVTQILIANPVPRERELTLAESLTASAGAVCSLPLSIF